MTHRARFQYPGEGPNMEIYSGALTPQIEKVSVKSSIRAPGGGPLFGRSVAGGRRRYVFALAWPDLSIAESELVIRDFETRGKRGTRPMIYIPDDGGKPIEVLCLQRPEVRYRSRQRVSITLELEEQR